MTQAFGASRCRERVCTGIDRYASTCVCTPRGVAYTRSASGTAAFADQLRSVTADLAQRSRCRALGMAKLTNRLAGAGDASEQSIDRRSMERFRVADRS